MTTLVGAACGRDGGSEADASNDGGSHAAIDIGGDHDGRASGDAVDDDDADTDDDSEPGGSNSDGGDDSADLADGARDDDGLADGEDGDAGSDPSDSDGSSGPGCGAAAHSCCPARGFGVAWSRTHRRASSISSRP